jgi:RNA polymerase sigma-70 factor, ECF subfamily
MESSELRVQLERYHRESYGWALCCCSRNPSEAEGVLQAVYLKVLEGKARFDGKASFKTWLFSVIRRTAADQRRQNVLHRLLLLKSDRIALHREEDESPDETIYRSEIQLLLRQALARLSRRQREVLQLVFYHDLTLTEAAEVMGTSVGSARTHYERGKKQIRQRMTESRAFHESRLGREETQEIVP